MTFNIGHISGEYGKETKSYDLSLGNTSTELIFIGIIGFGKLSFQLDTTGLDAGDATVQIQKTNINPQSNKFLDIVGATLTFASGTDTNFIEINGAKNENYSLVITVNSVTVGVLEVNLSASK